MLIDEPLPPPRTQHHSSSDNCHHAKHSNANQPLQPPKLLGRGWCSCGCRGCCSWRWLRLRNWLCSRFRSGLCSRFRDWCSGVHAHGDLCRIRFRPRGSTGNAGEPAAQRHGLSRDSRYRGSFGQRGSGRKSGFAVCTHGDLGGVGFRPRGTTGDTRESAAQGNVHRGHASSRSVSSTSSTNATNVTNRRLDGRFGERRPDGVGGWPGFAAGGAGQAAS